MSHPLPLNLVIFSTTAGHFKNLDVYQTTINQLERQCGGDLASVFANRVVHIKVRSSRPHEEERLPTMEKYFCSKGITCIVTRDEWVRGMSHQHAYLKDQFRMFHLPSVQAQPFTFFQEDDAPIHTFGADLVDLLARDLRVIDRHYNVLCTRYAWLGAVEDCTEHDARYLSSPSYHFQPHIARSRDLMIASNLIQGNWGQFSQLQCEAAFTSAMVGLAGNTGAERFLVRRPETAHAFHLGGEDYQAVRAQYGV